MSIEQDTGRQERREGSAELPVQTLVPKHQLMAGTTLADNLAQRKEQKSPTHEGQDCFHRNVARGDCHIAQENQIVLLVF